MFSVGISGRQRERRWQDDSGWRQLTRPWKPHALRCSHEGWHIFAFQHLGKKAGTHSRSTRRRPTGGSRRRKSGWRSCLSAHNKACSLGRICPSAAEASGRRSSLFWRRWSTWRRPSRRFKAVEEQQALISERLSNGAKQGVQTEPHLSVGAQEIGQEKLFVWGDVKPRKLQEASGEGFGSLDRRGTVPAKSVLEHHVCSSASVPGRGTMPAKASLGASRVSVRERSSRGACQQSCLACPSASLGWPKPSPVCHGWTQAWSTRCGRRGRMPSSVLGVGGEVACGVARRGQLAGSRAKLLGETSSCQPLEK